MHYLTMCGTIILLGSEVFLFMFTWCFCSFFIIKGCFLAVFLQ